MEKPRILLFIGLIVSNIFIFATSIVLGTYSSYYYLYLTKVNFIEFNVYIVLLGISLIYIVTGSIGLISNKPPKNLINLLVITNSYVMFSFFFFLNNYTKEIGLGKTIYYVLVSVSLFFSFINLFIYSYFYEKENRIKSIIYSLIISLLIIMVSYLFITPRLNYYKLDGKKHYDYLVFDTPFFVVTRILVFVVSNVLCLTFLNNEKQNKKITIFNIFLGALNIALISLFIGLHKYYNKNELQIFVAAGLIFMNIFIIFFNLFKKTNDKNDELNKNKKINNNLQAIIEGSMMVCLSISLSLISNYIPLFNMPFGGHVSLSMLPLVVYGLRRGILYGGVVGLLYSVVNFLSDGQLIHVGSIFLDYIVPFTLVGLVAGIFKYLLKYKFSYLWISLAVILAGSFRYISHSLSGYLFFAEYAPEGMSAAYYSFIVYNLPYMAISTGLTLLFALLLNKYFINPKKRVI